MTEMISCPYCNGSYSTAGYIHASDCQTIRVEYIYTPAVVAQGEEQAEIEHLRAELEKAERKGKQYESWYRTTAKQRDEARQVARKLYREVERLRWALAEYANRDNWTGFIDGPNCLWIPDEDGYTRAEEAMKGGE